MRHENILDPQHTALVIIDMQEAFRSSISDFAETSANIALIGHALGMLDVPIIITEQYPKGLGHTASEISAVLPSSIEPIEKTAFSSCGAQQFVARLKDVGGAGLVCASKARLRQQTLTT